MLPRRPLIAILSAIGIFLPMASAMAQTPAGPAFPSKPIMLVVPYPAGGPVDVLGRKLGEALSANLGTPVVIENKPGASATIGATFVARAPADGHTLLLTLADPLVGASALMKSLPYAPERDFSFISKIADGGGVLIARPALSAASMQAMLALAKAAPTSLSYGSTGNGSLQQLVMEVLGRQTGAKFLEVRYKGTGPTVQDLMADRLDLTVSSGSFAAPLIASGKVKALAVTGGRRNPLLPDVPTFKEAGLDHFVYSNRSWIGLVGPAALPAPVLGRLAQAVQTALKDPQLQNFVTGTGLEVAAGSPAEFQRDFQQEFSVVPRLIRDELRIAPE